MRINEFDVIVIGTGAAGYNAACRIQEDGRRTVAIVTEGVNCGTSRNTGSDKQTYYKLGLGGDSCDSVRQMAENLFAGGSVDGDNALCEAALSARSFLHLCELGVPFPVNRYGEYVGYKTDHDPFARATSAGPLTSKFMTEALQRKAENLDIPAFSGYLAVEILRDDDGVCGVLCMEKTSGELVAFRCSDAVLATGGPSGIYADNVYPACHTGSTGLALLSGVKAQNLTEWQYGLASVSPRWNVSGTYMQVLPRFVSVDNDGTEHEFLSDYFENVYEALSQVFLKGYQWPFDSKKVLNGSSVIDLLVYRECVLHHRRVYLDFTRNPFDLEEIAYERLSDEAEQYLKKAEACFGTPIDRLMKMNAPAVELYQKKGVDISKEYLEIALCAQHHNGGIAVDMWWQTTLRGLFAVGECAGTHGVTRPGGSALNAGQVGSLRAAQYICEHPHACSLNFDAVLFDALERHAPQDRPADGEPVGVMIMRAQRRMSDHAAAIRDRSRMQVALDETKAAVMQLRKPPVNDRWAYYKLRDILITQQAVLTAMIDYAETVGDTRGSSLYYDSNGCLRSGLEEQFRFTEESGITREKIQETWLEGSDCVCKWRPVRPLPTEEGFFENVWRSYRENKNVF